MMNNKEIYVDRIIELCLNVNLFELLDLSNGIINVFLRNKLFQDIFSLLHCNKYLSKLITRKLLKCNYFPMLDILK